MHLLFMVMMFFSFSKAFAFESFSYSGRLVNLNGSPVTGPVNLSFELAYSNQPSVILCNQDLSNVGLVNGVFHVKLEFSGCNLSEVFANTPIGNTVSIRIIDRSADPDRIYSFQAIHSVPSSIMSNLSKQLVQMGATNGQVLTWNGTQWAPADAAGTVGGVTTIVGAQGISAVKVDETVTVGIIDGAVTSQKLDSMGAITGQVLKWNGSQWTAAADVDTGLTAEADPTVRAFARSDVTGITPEICNPNQVLHYVSVDNSLRCFDLVNDAIVDGESNKAPSQNAVFDALALKQNTVDTNSELLMKSVRVTNDGTTWVGIKAPNAAGNIYFTLPAGAGVDGQVLKTDGAGNLAWVTPTTNSGSIVDGSIVDADIAAGANIAQSKISGLSTSFTNLDNRITSLTTSDIAEGTNQYFTEPRVLGTDLAGLNTANGAITAADTVLSSIGKLIGNLAVVSTAQSNYVLKTGDTMSGNLQMGGFAVTGLAVPAGDSDAATKKYVDDLAVAGASKWTKNANDISYSVGNVGIGTTSPLSKLHVNGEIRANSFKQVPITQTVKGLTWSRIVDLNEDSVLGTAFILSISGTRSNVVWNSTWLVSTSHAMDGFLTLLSSTDYTQSRLRLVIDNNGGGYVEFYDQGTGATLGVDQSLKIVINNYVGSSVVLASFIDGSDSTGFTVLPEAISIPGGIVAQGGGQFSKGIRIGNDGATCDATKTGTIRYNSGNVEYCNGSSWLTFGVSGAGITSLNGSNSATQTFAIGTSGTSPGWSTAAGVHTINIPLASAGSVTAGLLSKADYDAFNAKLGTSTSFTGDVSGNYNSTSVDKIKGTPLVMSSLTTSNFLKFNGTNWINSMLAATDIPNLDAAKITTGVLPVSRGGTNTSSLSGNRIMVSTTTAITEAAALTNGQLLIGSTGAAPVAANLTAGSGVTITNSAGGISISATGTGGTVTSVSGSAPISVATGTTTPVISISQSNSTTNGYLSSTDWNTFNNKQNSLASGATINGIVYPASVLQTLQIPLAPINLTDVVNKQYVDNTVATAANQWTQSGSNIYRTFGNVGIGVTAPATKLQTADLYTNTTDTTGLGISVFGSGSDYGGLTLWDRDGNTATTNDADTTLYWGDDVGESLRFAFKLSGAALSEKMRITSAGNLGIGTTNPSEKLVVAGNGTFWGKIEADFNGVQDALHVHQEGSGNIASFSQGPGWDEKVVINNAGDVGIGRTPIGKLAVAGNTLIEEGEVSIENYTPGIAGRLNIHGQDDGYNYGAQFFYNHDWSKYWGLGHRSYTSEMNNFFIEEYDGSNYNIRLAIKPGGNVGIGTNQPTSKLEVNGQIAGKSIKTRLFTAGGKTSGSCTLSDANILNSLTQFCDLTITLTLTDPASVQINYSITMPAGPSGPDAGSKHLVTGININGSLVTTTIGGMQISDGPHTYWGVGQSHFAELPAGTHTIRVDYRTPAGGTSHPASADWEDRKLQVMILGYQ